MRKIYLTSFFAVFLVTLFYGQDANNQGGWDYPIKLGSSQWKKLTTPEEQYNAFNIPENVINNLSTEELVNICINYPLFFNFTLYNNPKDGYNYIKDKFNGFQDIRTFI